MSSIDTVNSILAHRKATMAALKRLEAELAAIPLRSLRKVNLDVPSTVARVLGITSRMNELRPEIAKHTPTVDLARLAKLEDYAFALQEAHIGCMIVGRNSSDELPALGEAAESWRSLLRRDALTLAHRGLIDAGRLAQCKGLTGYRNVATELGAYVAVLLDAWPKIEGRSAITMDELTRARAVADTVLQYVGARDQSPEARNAALELRDRAFTAMVDVYEEARRAVVFLRWYDEDADSVVPSLYAGRSRLPKQDNDAEPATPEVPAVPVVPATSSAPATPATSEAAKPAAPQTFGAPGTPTSNPFMQ